MGSGNPQRLMLLYENTQRTIGTLATEVMNLIKLCIYYYVDSLLIGSLQKVFGFMGVVNTDVSIPTPGMEPN